MKNIILDYEIIKGGRGLGETQAKYHHLIPQTYMAAWANNSGTLNIEFLNNPGIIQKINKKRIAGRKDNYSIQVGMSLCNQEDADKIFSPLSKHTVEVDGVEVTNSLELNKLFYCFDEWKITREDGSLESNKTIKKKIKRIKKKEIETNWALEYENKWNFLVKKIEDKVLYSTATSISTFNKENIIKFFVSLDWRGYRSNRDFEEVLESYVKDVFSPMEIPTEERILPFLKNEYEEIRHELLLNNYRKLFQDKGNIHKYINFYIQHGELTFLIADGPTYFDTSDNPAFEFTNGATLGLMAVTPRILMIIQQKNNIGSNKYLISHITDDEVQQYNATIRKNASKFVIHPMKDI